LRALFTPSARRQYLAAIAYIAKDNPRAATRLNARVAAALKRLQKFPSSGRFVPEFPELPHREIFVPPYRFFYRIERDSIWIIAVWHGTQSPRPDV